MQNPANDKTTTETPGDGTPSEQATEARTEEAAGAAGQEATATAEKAGEGANESGSESGSDYKEPPRPRQPTYIETLERRLQETQDQLRDYIQAYKKVKEEMDDFKRRLEREAQKDLTLLRGRVVSDLLEVLDNLDRSVSGGEAGWNADALLTGMRLVQTQFVEKLQGLGMVVINPVGQNFNPNEAEALDMTITHDQTQDEKVTRVYTRGYKLNDRVVRAARVQVARYVEADAQA